ncbi:valine--pyruvate transaminase [Promineifilum sp.]|uniref:valine--pyruvate transaminase n=1 Tax=Promineifilum sp. TaxID=2664178 RepID=UPI0035B42EBC
MRLSQFGEKFARDCGILRLMDDLGSALAGGEAMISLGGGNPSRIPQVEACLRERMERGLQQGDTFERLVGNYAAPAGDRPFRQAVAGLLHREFDWPVTEANIALTNGSQTAFFYLFNMFAGRFSDGSRRKILLPLTPEYIGYADVGLDDDIFVSYRPEIEYLDGRRFKYRVDFDALQVTPHIGAICVSRPTNPTGNVLTDEEIGRLHALARHHDIPLIIDNAYGPPFPSILFKEVRPVWDERIVFCLSLSKLGLPGARTGIVVAAPEIAAAVAGANAVLSLAPGNFGAYMALDLVESGDVLRLSREVIRPHYQRKAMQALDYIAEELDGIDYYVHDPEGAFFLWLWFPGLPIGSQELYERLKARRVLVVPGHYFFPGLADDWQHRQECLRMNYAQEDAVVREGIRIIGEVVREAGTRG